MERVECAEKVRRKKLKFKKQAGRGELFVRVHAIGEGPKLFWDAN
jgi:hypothetical protein